MLLFQCQSKLLFQDFKKIKWFILCMSLQLGGRTIIALLLQCSICDVSPLDNFAVSVPMIMEFQHIIYFKIKLTSKYKCIVCALKNYNFKFKRKNPNLESGFEPQTSRSLAWRSTTRIAQVVEQPARVWRSEVHILVQVQIFSLEFKIVILQGANYRFVFTCQFNLKRRSKL